MGFWNTFRAHLAGEDPPVRSTELDDDLVAMLRRRGATPGTVDRIESEWREFTDTCEAPHWQWRRLMLAFVYGFMAGQDWESECGKWVNDQMKTLGS